MQHDRVWERAAPARQWTPKGTYGLLAAIGITYVLQLLVLATAPGLHNWIFAIQTFWFLQPWALVTSTLSHGGLDHIFFNCLILYFFGPITERILGTRRYVILFMIAGAISGILQVTISPGAALGASGALMMIFGTLVMVMPKEKLLLWFVLPVPFWLMGIIFVVLDVLGALNPYSPIGNIAHLSGMGMGLWLGWRIRQQRKQPRIHVHWTAMR